MARARIQRLSQAGPRRAVKLPPPLLLAVLYFGLVVAGTGLLMLPACRTGPLSLADAFFTATSAVTVTGLVVVDTGSQFTFAGQAVIALLIQLGGLGLMTFAVLVLAALGLPISLPQRMVLREDLNRTSIHDLIVFVGIIVRTVVICEALGTAALAVVFVPEFGWWPGLWHAAFHAISAFNNAGFALFPDSLTRYATNPVVNLSIPALFIIGGLGFAVLSDIARLRRWRRYSLHSKLMLTGTAVLIAASVPIVAALEWTNPATLGAHEGWGARLWVAWFQAVTPRTAGFNTMDFAGAHDATALFTIMLMLIGGGSTSTAGGIKVTTVLVLLLATRAFFRRHRDLTAFGRSLGLEQVLKVMALTTLALVLVMTSIFAVSISHDGDFLDLAFEVASAFGTVGLSRGTTAELDIIGRTVIVALMFLGRVGPLTLGFFLATRVAPRIRYPRGEVFLG